jgi:5-methylcytosine-specific restriction endonuclease McrA
MAYNLQGLCKPCNGAKSATLEEGTQLGIFDRLVAV